MRDSPSGWRRRTEADRAWEGRVAAALGPGRGIGSLAGAAPPGRDRSLERVLRSREAVVALPRRGIADLDRQAFEAVEKTTLPIERLSGGYRITLPAFDFIALLVVGHGSRPTLPHQTAPGPTDVAHR